VSVFVEAPAQTPQRSKIITYLVSVEYFDASPPSCVLTAARELSLEARNWRGRSLFLVEMGRGEW
jgi:hypothetical protein